jgi:hypothetical protein
MVTLGRSELIEVKEEGTLMRSANPSLTPGLPPIGELEFLEGRVFAIPAAPEIAVTTGGKSVARIFVAGSRGLGDWVDAAPPGFGDSENVFASAIAAFSGRIYVAVANPWSGFQLWHTEGSGSPPFSWTPVLKEGAYRFTLNATATALVPDGDQLYIATSATASKLVDAGIRAPEILRIDKDGNWDVVVGTARFTPAGLKRPVSGYAAGFGAVDRAAFTRMHRLNGTSVVRLNRYVADSDDEGGGYSGPGGAWVSRDWIAWRRIAPPR